MDYERKKRWIKYSHIKCKMYLRNDFRFECAYCRIREQDTGAVGKAALKRIIFLQNIYSGDSPHVKNLGKSGQYQLSGNTIEGRQYIKNLKLNSKFYREMREKQDRANKDDYELEKLMKEISDDSDVPQYLLLKLRALICNNYSIHRNNQQDSAFRCGHSKAGQAFQEVLDILDNLSVSYTLLFAENDIDIKVQYNGKEYLCEIVLNDSTEKPVRDIHVKKEQRESWLAEDGEHGIMYYYMKTGRLEFYSVGAENVLLACLKNG